MFACLHMPGDFDASAKLAELAGLFSPNVEVCDPATVVFPVDGLSRLIGQPDDIAAAIAREGERRGVRARLAIAANPDAALQAARHYRGVTVIPPGQEAARLAGVPLSQLPMPPEMRDTLARWGIRTFSEFAALPPLGVAERFGMEGVELQDLARGAARRPLQIHRRAQPYRRNTELEDGLDNLEPLMFLLNGMLVDLCKEMSGHGVAAGELRLRFDLDNKVEDAERVLSLPVPMREPAPMLKLLQLHLEANPPQAEVLGVSLTMQPVEPRVAQGGLFSPQAPEPARLQITLARIGGIVGEGNAGRIELLDTHRPDAFVVKPFLLTEESASSRRHQAPPHAPQAMLALRLFRPPLAARVIADNGHPRRISAPGVSGNVTELAGPWRGSGDWWNQGAWAREEWDVSLTDGGLYRVYRDATKSETWFIAGVYD